ncbi:intracellular coagulation inhibitor 3 isoform X2 [Dermacentor silvarum]|uniref:intracellular coagulation inhibitor 3 isoform X2 n=1 Tax=Dermacentor silvarum TaxID=543639 RepID=UPI0021018352|nr:intracellular coagulation inhibitor 3 isoform X2 [Dermacentor silvarum]
MLTKFVFLVAVFVVVNCEHDDDTLLAKAHNQFAVNLLKHLATQDPSSNVFFSPTSIAAAFGMAYAGARGSSEAELGSVLGHTAVGLTDRARVLAAYRSLLQLSASPNVTLDVANMVLAQSGFPITDNYKQQLREVFDAELRSADFVNEGPSVAAEVNAWVRDKTRGKISGILPEGRPLDIVLFILNAVYFKGTWVTKFDVAKTVNKPFFNLGTTEVSKPAMHLRNRLPHTRVDALHASALEIPYLGGKFSMVVMLPDTPTGLQTLRDGLSVATLEDLGSNLRTKDVILQMPKLEMSLSYNLVAAMKALGLNTPFGGSADFSGITEGTPVHISDAVHKVAVEVNEEGTVAAAVTGLSIVPISALNSPPPPVLFTVDRPFLYYIRDKNTNRILFIGEVHSL